MRRVKSKAICYLGPLPDDLPKPAQLKAELHGVCLDKRLTASVSTTNCCVKKKCGNLTRLYSLPAEVRSSVHVLVLRTKSVTPVLLLGKKIAAT